MPSRIAGGRSLLVNVLNLAVETWETGTDKTKADLAQESGQWGAHLEKIRTWRTRSLDKYLPQKPHWRKAVQTTRHVLRHTPEGRPLPTSLTERLEELESLLHHSRFWRKRPLGSVGWSAV